MSETDRKPDDWQQFRDAALCRGVLYGTLSLGLHYPTPETFTELRSEKTRTTALQAGVLLSPDAPAEELSAADVVKQDLAIIDLARRVQSWIETFEPLTLDLLLSAHGRLFGHTARGLVCPYEAEYGQEGLFQQPRQLARIAGLYRAFGLASRRVQRADHVSCELEFLDFLSRKEAYAIECADEEMLVETRKATRVFLKDHVSRFGRAFARLLTEQDPDGFFGKLGELLFDFVTLDCRRLGFEPGPSGLRLRPAEEEDIPMACGGQSELVQLEAGDREQ